MNDSTEPLAEPRAEAAPDHSTTAAERLRNRTSIFLPKGIYEALPAAYIAVGMLFIVGAVYIGISHWLTIGYLIVGVACIFAGVTVNTIRSTERSRSGSSALA